MDTVFKMVNRIKVLSRLFVCFMLVNLSLEVDLEIADECTSPLGLPGVCRLVIQCAPALRSIRKDGFHKLRRCGFWGLSEIVCCVEGKDEAGVGDRFAPDPANTEANAVSTTQKPFRPPVAPPATRPPTPRTSRPATFPTRPTTERPPPRTRPSNSINGDGQFDYPPTSATPKMDPGPNTDQRFPDPNENTTEYGKKRKADIECEKIVNSLPPPLDSYILGGVEAEVGEFPYHVTIGYKAVQEEPDKKDSLEFLCGGTLISQKFVMSAGHCFRNVRNRVASVVRVGVVNLGTLKNKNETDYEIDQVMIHPEYMRKPRELHNDISLIRLVKPVPITNLAHPACLMTKPEVPARNLIVTGFGVTDFGSKQFSEVLLKASLIYVPNEVCAKSYDNVIRLEDNMLCAGDPDGLRDACQGDSGGPLQALTEKDGHYRIIGITSFGRQCGTTTPGVYTRVTSHLDWIESVVWGST